MAGIDRIFVDSNYFVALFNKNDSLHKKARSLGIKIIKEGALLVISNFIFLEVTTILSQKRGREVGINVGEYLLSNPLIEIIQVDEMLQEKSWQIFKETKNKNMGFIDCSIIAIMKAEHISQLLTFDSEDFKKLKAYHRFQIYDNATIK